MITGINESKTLSKHISCQYKCKFDGRKYNSDGKYFASIMDDSAITCNEIIESCDEETKTFPINFNEKKATCKPQNFYILLEFSLITIALLIAVSIYCYLIKYLATQKTKKMSSKVKDIDIKNCTYSFFDDIINIKNFDANNIKIDGKSYKNILI